MTNPTINTFLDRCCIALEEGIKANGRPAHSYRAQRAGVIAVLQHLSDELIELSQRDQRLTVHQLARLLKDAAR